MQRDEYRITFGELLRRLRIQAGLSQAELAKKSGVSTGTIGNYEAGHRARISFENAVKLSNALDVSIEKFIDVLK